MAPGQKREIIFEFIRFGASVKVTAVDVATGTEVSTIGPANAMEHDLKRLAAAKLERVLQRK